ncbi:DUF3761 domain-containing protein [Streptomyces sp. NPDC058695]|uniref:DUF3761 domain-containing protein n=1 Tax=Streptomyces sp. NPDC058695 TaxID=3346604 RepID=UPI003663C06A
MPRSIRRRHGDLVTQRRAASHRLHAPTLTLPSPPPGASAAGSLCRDGSLSHSTGRGTCSWHGGAAP